MYVFALKYFVHTARSLRNVTESCLQRKVVLSCVGVSQSRSALPSRDGEGVSVVPRSVRREVLLQKRDHLVDGHAVRVEKRVVVAPVP